jgi:hypothetical protein
MKAQIETMLHYHLQFIQRRVTGFNDESNEAHHHYHLQQLGANTRAGHTFSGASSHCRLIDSHCSVIDSHCSVIDLTPRSLSNLRFLL